MLIINGLVVFEDGVRKEDVRIEAELISEVAPSLPRRGDEQVIDAGGKFILPGGVDVHTHMDLDLGSVRATDDFFTGTVAAACGGTTTIVDHMAFGPRGCSIRHQAEAYHRLAEDKAVIDYGFHGVMDHVGGEILDEVETLAREGITSHKIYLTYDGKVSDAEVLRLLEKAAGLGILIAVHAENDGAIGYLRGKYKSLGKTAPIYHARSRPPECEAEAVGRVAMLAAIAGDAPVYIVHLSSGLGLEVIRAARERGQENLFAETCPQYLFLDESAYLRDDGLKYIMSPPLRTAKDRETLWAGVRGGGAAGVCDTVRSGDFDSISTNRSGNTGANASGCSGNTNTTTAAGCSGNTNTTTAAGCSGNTNTITAAGCSSNTNTITATGCSVNTNTITAAARSGEIDVIATDHCPFFYSREKQLGKCDFTLAPGGAPGVEARMPLMFSGIASGRLTAERLVTLCCANPARLFGLYPKKGVIAAGSDADLVLIDPEIKTALTHDMLHENCDYTPYEGLPLSGYPVMTISRGEVIVRNGQFLGQKGRGRFLKRGLPELSVK